MKFAAGLLLALLFLSGCANPAETVHEVKIYRGKEFLGGGSGVMIAPHLMLTASHVVSEVKDGMTLYVGADEVPAKVLRNDPEKDIALLQVAMDCPCAEMSKDNPVADDEVVAIGFPMYGIVGLRVTTHGIASGVNKDGKLVYTAPTAPGNSGGGVFVHRFWGWRLAGVVQGIVAMNMGFTAAPLPHLAIASSTAELWEFLSKRSVAEMGAVKGAPV